MKSHLLVAAFIAVCLFTSSTHIVGESKTYADRVKIKVDPTKPNDKGEHSVVVTLEIDQDWFMYANPVGNDQDNFKRVQTVVTVKGKGVSEVKIDYPAAAVVIREFDETWKEYRGTIQFRIQFQKDPSSKERVDIEVRGHVGLHRGSLMICPVPIAKKIAIY